MRLGLASFLWLTLGVSLEARPAQFIVFNVHPASEAEAFQRVSRELNTNANPRVRAGVGSIFSYLHYPRGEVLARLNEFLRRAAETDTPVVVQLDGENWWGARPDLWNWWDPMQPGYSPANRTNVEWTGWSPDNAIKIAWRNWGRQIRVLPPPNLMSTRYRAACHEEMRTLIPLVLDWWKALPAHQRDLLIGLKLGWESSIGVNAWHYPGGNTLLERPATEDPTSGLRADELPARGVAQIGYAAVKTAGLRHAGQVTEADLAEVLRRHLEDLCRLAAELGVPREKLFTHIGGWKENEMLYQSALNKFGCPGWSFYRHAAEPTKDTGVVTALQRSDAPFWAAVEWLFQGPRETIPWRAALTATLADPRCRYVCIYNWPDARDHPPVLQAIREVLADGNATTRRAP